MDKHSKYRPLLDEIQSEIMLSEVGVTGVYQYMLEALDGAEKFELALHDDIEVLKADVSILSNNIEALESDKDKLMDSWEEVSESESALREELAALKQSMPKIRADAIRDMLTCIDGAIENDFISMREVEEMTLDDFFTLAKKHANKIEDGS
jgi:hypothetical protein